MNRFDSPYMTDWFAISMRWIVLVALVVSLGLSGQLKFEFAWPLILLIGWNLGMTAFAGMNSRLKFHRPISLAADLILTGAFFWVQGGLNGPAFWAVVLPVINGAIFYELWGALIAAVMISMLLIITTAGSKGNLSLAISVGFGFYLLAFLFGVLGHSLVIHVRRSRQHSHDSEDQKHRVQTERLRALYELTSTLAATLSYKRVLDSALEMGPVV